MKSKDVSEDELIREVDQAFLAMPRRPMLCQDKERIRILRMCKKYLNPKPEVPVFNHDKNKMEFL